MIYNLIGDFEEEILDPFIDFLNQPHLDPERPLTIYLNSGGGNVWVQEQLRSIIQNHPGKIKLIASSFIGSSAFDLFFLTKGVEKEILPRTYGMCHLGSWAISYNGKLKPSNEYQEFKVKYMRDDTILEEVVKATGINKTELKLIEQGKDLWIPNKRLQAMLKYNKKVLK